MIDKKIMFTAMFIEHERSETSIYDSISHFRDVRTKGGFIVKKWLSLSADIMRNIVGHLTRGEVINFTADVVFTNIEFQYPNALLTE